MDITQLPKRITELREAKGYTVNKLATRAGISQSFLRDIELGNKKPTVETLDAICWALDISLSDFFCPEPSRLSDQFVQEFNRLTSEQQKHLLAFLKSLP